MPLLLKKAGTTTKSEPAPTPIPAPVLKKPPQMVKTTPKLAIKPPPVPTKPLAAAKPPAPAVALPKPLPKGGVRLGIKPPVKLTKSDTQALVDAGLMDAEEPEYERIDVYDRIVITNSMFPWVKHYKPGDRGRVIEVRKNQDPLGVESDLKYGLFHIELDDTKDRKNQRCLMFRHEIEKLKNTDAAPIKGQVVNGLKG